MLNNKEKRIVQILLEDREKFVTSRELATQLNCSDRTIRTYYKSLVEKVSEYPGIAMISKQGFGYKFKIENEESFAKFLQDNKISTNKIRWGHSLDIEDRYNYLLNKLLFDQKEIYFDDLVDELFVSRSTLSNDFRKIRQDFAPYDLSIESKANKGVYVTGSERNKRRFIMDYFINSGFMNTMHFYVDNDLLSMNITLEELTIIVLDECREAKLRLSDFVIQNLVIHIALSIRRIEEGFKIAKLNEKIDIQNLEERKVAKKILARISQVTGIDFPVEEIDYITLHLISKSMGKRNTVAENVIFMIRKELQQAIIEFAPQFQGDFQLLEGLVTHLSTMLIRLESQVNLENPMATEIQQKYNDMYVLAEKVIDSMWIFKNFSLSVDEIAYVALHFMAAKERFKEQNKYNILVICATGYGSAQMLKSRIENELGNIVKIADVIGYYEIDDEKLKGIDFVISSIDLSSLIFSIPVFTVSVFLTDEEIKKIKSGIAQLSKSGHRLPEKKVNPKQIQNFDDYFSKEAFMVFEKTTKEEVLDCLIHSIESDERDYFAYRMKKMLQQREQLSSVVFSEQIAVPHPIQAMAKHHRIAVAVIPEGLYWNEEFQNIQFVFLTSMSVYENDGLPDLAATIVDLVDYPDIQEKMLNDLTFDNFKKRFISLMEER